MLKIGRTVVVFALLSGGGPVAAQSAASQSAAQADCAYQAAVVGAVRQARLDRVKERQVPDKIAETAPGWPAKYNAVVPLVTPWVYEMKMRDVKSNDLAAAWNEMCLAR